MVDHLSGLAMFVETVQAGGFSAAATRLNLSRSAVGKTVGRLERRLGVRLFHRTTRSQALTEDGQAFYERCLRALAEIRTGEAMLESGKREVVGRLRISLPVLFGRRCVAPILTELARRHPRLELDLNFSDRMVDLMEDGFDLAIRNGALGDGAIGDGVGLMSRRIGSQRMTVCAAPAYLAEHGTPRSIADLGEHEAVVYGRAGRVKPWLFPANGGPPVAFQPNSRLRFDDLDAIADAAAAGAGLTWLPCWLIRDHVRAGSLVRVLADHPGLVFDVYALWPQTPHLPLRVRLAIDRLAEALPDPLS